MATYIYSNDGSKKVNIDTSTLLGDVLNERGICRQGDRSQLWRSASGSYFTGSCLDFWKGSGKNPKYEHIVPISKEQAKSWVIEYFGADDLSRFGFENDSEEI